MIKDIEELYEKTMKNKESDRVNEENKRHEEERKDSGLKHSDKKSDTNV